MISHACSYWLNVHKIIQLAWEFNAERTHLVAHVNGAFDASTRPATTLFLPARAIVRASLGLSRSIFLNSRAFWCRLGTGLVVYVTMAIVFHLPPRTYQFLALQIVVYWAIVGGHMASGFSPLIGIPLLPLLVVQIILIIHVWTNLVTKHQSPRGGVSSQ